MTKSEKPVVSAIITSYNYACYLEQAICSVLDQKNAPSFEVIIVDDGSTDDSLKIASKYADRVKIISINNSGQGGALNLALEAVRGDWILMLDADDYLLPGALETISKQMDSDVSLIHYRLQCVNKEGHDLGITDPRSGLLIDSGNLISKLMLGNKRTCPPTSGITINRKLLTSYLPIPTKYYTAAIDFYITTCGYASGRVAAIQSALACYRLHGKNASNNHSGKRTRSPIRSLGNALAVTGYKKLLHKISLERGSPFQIADEELLSHCRFYLYALRRAPEFEDIRLLDYQSISHVYWEAIGIILRSKSITISSKLWVFMQFTLLSWMPLPVINRALDFKEMISKK